MKFPLFRLLKLGNGIKQEECFMPYLIVAVVVVIFIAVVFIVAGKDSKERIDMVSKLTEEQRNILMSTEVNFVEKDVAITKSEQEEHNVKEGDFVKFYFAPEKSIGRTKIIWE